MPKTVLVTGASGQLGRLAVEALIPQNPGTIIAASRDPAKLADLAARGVETRRIDFDDVASMEAAFAGVDAVLLVSTDVIDAAGTRLRQQQAAVAAAKAAGVSQIVYTSMPKPEPGSAIIFAADHYGTELAVKASGLGYTILRCSWYQENLERSLPGVLASGQWYTAAGDGKVSHVARADIAAVAAAALIAAPANQTLDVTSDEALTTAEIAALASEVFGKPINVVQVSDEALIAGIAAHGLPEPVARFIACFDTNTRLGGTAAPTDTVRRLTGRTPRTLRAHFEASRAVYLGA